MVKLNVAFHGCLPGADVEESNLWFDAEVSAQDLLDALDGDGYEGMTRLLEDCYDEASHYYRVDYDNNQVPVDEELNHNLSDALGYDEWHVDVDWDNGRYLCILGAGFGEEMASEELINYLKNHEVI